MNNIPIPLILLRFFGRVVNIVFLVLEINRSFRAHNRMSMFQVMENLDTFEYIITSKNTAAVSPSKWNYFQAGGKESLKIKKKKEVYGR